MPAAIQLGVKLTLTPRSDNRITLRSATHSYKRELFLDDDIYFDKKFDWTNYPAGIIAQLKKENHSVPACDLLFESTLPEGSGLSSSAAVELVTAYALLSVSETNINRVWLASLCKETENSFIGVGCGIMDQYAVALGKKDNALLLDCSALKHDYIPFELGDYSLLILDSKKPRSLIQSKYNERKKECEEALRIIQTSHSNATNLCEAEMYFTDLITDNTVRKRARHVISEQLRVKEAARVLRMNDLSTFGRLMNASHQSLKADYEVSGLELDVLAETAQSIKGCLGARMTGAGFGGCAIALVHSSAVNEVKEKISTKYFEATGTNCAIYKAEISEGVSEL